jgi:tetratricopeptide (TPR) repeat protein
MSTARLEPRMVSRSRLMRRLAFVSIPLLGVVLLGSILYFRRPAGEVPGKPTPPIPKVASVDKKEGIPPTPTQPKRDIESEARVFFKSGLEKTQGGDPQGAIADFDQALSLKEDWGEAHYNRAVAKTMLKDYSGAILDYDRMIDLKKGGAEVYYNRGIAQLAQGRPKEAILDFDKAIAGRGDWPEAFYNRGLVREGLQDYRGAEKDYLQALQVAPPAWPSRASLEERIALLKKKP